MDRLDQILNRLASIESHLNRQTSRWMTVGEAARYLKLSERSIRRYLKKGALPKHALPQGTIRIEKMDLDSLVLFGLPFKKLTRPQRERIDAARDL